MNAPLLIDSKLLHEVYPGTPNFGSNQMIAKAEADLTRAAQLHGVGDLIGETPDPTEDNPGDVEDFWENVARAAAAHRAAEVLGRSIQTHHAGLWSDDEMARRVGPVAKIEESDHGTDPLLMHPVFVQNSGRWVSLAGYSSEPDEFEPEHDLVQLILSRARTGVTRVVVKFAARKTGVFTIELWETMTAQDVTTLLMTAGDEHVGWQIIRLDGIRDQFLVQDWIDMTYEYRLFIVDGQVISGAGCIEEFTPYDRISPDSCFDTRVRKHRGHGIVADKDSEITRDPVLVGEYLDFGDAVAAAHGGTVGIDVATNAATGEVVIVELNTLPNSGLYASNPDAVYRAQAVAADRGYGTYALSTFDKTELNAHITHGARVVSWVADFSVTDNRAA